MTGRGWLRISPKQTGDHWSPLRAFGRNALHRLCLGFALFCRAGVYSRRKVLCHLCFGSAPFPRNSPTVLCVSSCLAAGASPRPTNFAQRLAPSSPWLRALTLPNGFHHKPPLCKGSLWHKNHSALAFYLLSVHRQSRIGTTLLGRGFRFTKKRGVRLSAPQAAENTRQDPTPDLWRSQ